MTGHKKREIPRREFVTLPVTAALTAAAGRAGAAGIEVVEDDVEFKTRDGICDAAFVHPGEGSYPGVLLWTDAFGLRRSMRDIAKRLAAEGYAVLVPNPFYRVAKDPFEDASRFNFQDPDAAARLQPLMLSVNERRAAERDAAAYVAFLDEQKEVDKSKRIGTLGYCMGGPLVVRTAAAVHRRIGAGASFHGGNLVTNRPDSPHLLAPKIGARMYFGIASNDDMRQPDAKVKLKEAFPRKGDQVEVYAGARHGWCVADMPWENGAPIYNQEAAERAWGKLTALFKTALA